MPMSYFTRISALGLLRDRSEASDLLVPLPIGCDDDQTGHEHLLVNIQTTAPFIGNSMSCLLMRDFGCLKGDARPCKFFSSCSHSRSCLSVATLVVPSCISDQSLLRASRTSEIPIHFLFGFLLLLYSFSWIVERPWRMAVSSVNYHS